ncbi:hypothetical protein NLG97_g7004 [Lecanicillium saksenae]|uniref:Uncharacterized protein n=1 Tax=Lecanicillium saksenae TaxID=468837 RepID=A0ACC1QNL0_9HYPO|nr:hypothetical protein NLG97_g7004 [Lecanicillium saksenae]
MSTNYQVDNEAQTTRSCVPIASLYQPVQVGQIGCRSGHAGTSTFFRWPILGALLFDNESSDARDHCANERSNGAKTSDALSVLMAIVSMAMTLSFHLKNEPSTLEKHIAKPLGAIFWLLAVLILAVGTVNLYSKRAAIVQSGWRTQTVLGILSAAIFATCVVLLVINTMKDSAKASK